MYVQLKKKYLHENISSDLLITLWIKESLKNS